MLGLKAAFWTWRSRGRAMVIEFVEEESPKGELRGIEIGEIANLMFATIRKRLRSFKLVIESLGNTKEEEKATGDFWP